MKLKSDKGLEVPAGAPTGLSAVVNPDGSVVFSWKAGPAGTVPTVRYDLEFSWEGSNNGAIVSSIGVGTSITVRSLPTRATISWTVRAASVDGLGARSAPSTFFIGQPLAVPVLDAAFYDGSAMVLDFTGAERDALYVQVVVRETGKTAVVQRIPMIIQDGTLVRVTQLTWGVSYDFTVRSMLTSTQFSNESNQLTAVYGSGVPAAPSFAGVTENPNGVVTVSWNKPTQFVDHYSFGWKKTADAAFVWLDNLDRSLTSRIVANLDPTTQYTFAVKAVNRYGVSPASTRDFTTASVSPGPGPGPQPGPGGYLNILGHYDTLAALRAAKPTGKLGDLYLVGEGVLYAWDGGAWVESGQVVGNKGDKGDLGPVGPSGPAGKDGAQGPKGDLGVPGAKGDAGSAGPKGEQGIAGPAGVAGPAGPVGKDGAAGPSGQSGERGEQGPQGIEGPEGLQGPEGPMGLQGDNGPEGPEGPMGPEGHGFQLQGHYDTLEHLIAAHPVGNPGDAYLIGEDDHLYAWDDEELLWADCGSIQGPTGAPGPAGVKGADGRNGDPGAMGPQGLPGPAGAKGADGASGVVAVTTPITYNADTKTVGADVAWLDARYSGGGGTSGRFYKDISDPVKYSSYTLVPGDEKALLYIGPESQNSIKLGSMASLPAGSVLQVMRDNRPWFLTFMVVVGGMKIRFEDNRLGLSSIYKTDLIEFVKISDPGDDWWMLTNGTMMNGYPQGARVLLAAGVRSDDGITVQIRNLDPTISIRGYQIQVFNEAGAPVFAEEVLNPKLTSYKMSSSLIVPGNVYVAQVWALGYDNDGRPVNIRLVCGAVPDGTPYITGFSASSEFYWGVIDYQQNGAEGELAFLEVNSEVTNSCPVETGGINILQPQIGVTNVVVRVGVGYTPEDAVWSQPIFIELKIPDTKPLPATILQMDNYKSANAVGATVTTQPSGVDNLTRISIIYKPVGTKEGKVLSIDEFRPGQNTFTFDLELGEGTYEAYVQTANAAGFTNTNSFVLNGTGLSIVDVTPGNFCGTDIRVALPDPLPSPAPKSLFARMRAKGDSKWTQNPEQRNLYGDGKLVTFGWGTVLPFAAPDEMEIQVSLDGKSWTGSAFFKANPIGMVALSQQKSIGNGASWFHPGQAQTGFTLVKHQAVASTLDGTVTKTIDVVDAPELGSQFKMIKGLDSGTEYSVVVFGVWQNNVTKALVSSKNCDPFLVTPTGQTVPVAPTGLRLELDTSKSPYWVTAYWTDANKGNTAKEYIWVVTKTLDGKALRTSALRDYQTYLPEDYLAGGKLDITVCALNDTGASPAVSASFNIPKGQPTTVKSVTSPSKGVIELAVSDDSGAEGLMVSLTDASKDQHSELAKKTGEGVYQVSSLHSGTWTVTASLERNGGTTAWSDESQVSVK